MPPQPLTLAGTTPKRATAEAAHPARYRHDAVGSTVENLLGIGGAGLGGPCVVESRQMDDEKWAAWHSEWTSVLDGVRRLEAPAVATELIVRPPASSAEMAELDRSGVELPAAMVDVVATRSSRVGFHWRLFELDGDAEIEAPMFGPNTPMWGGCHAADAPGALWDLATLPSLVQTHRRWLDACFLAWLDEDPNDPYAAPWPNKLPIIEVGSVT